MPVYAADLLEVPDPVVSPEPADFYGEALSQKRAASVAVGGGMAGLRFSLRDATGAPIDLSPYGMVDSAEYVGNDPGDYVLVAKVREAVRSDSPATSELVSVDAAATGLVTVRVPDPILDAPGIYVVEVAVVSALNSRPLVITPCYLWVDASAWSADGGTVGPPSLDAVRASLWDDDILRNMLTDHRGFPLGDLCEAAVRTIRLWNETNPPVANRMTSRDFPYRDLWIEGIQLHAFLAVEEFYRRNFLKHATGGTAVEDLNRERQYKVAWQERHQSFTDRMRQLKVQLNISGGIASLGSGYRW